MKKIFAIGLAGILSAAGLFAEQVLNGAGASFPAPVYQAWSYGYTQRGSGELSEHGLRSRDQSDQIWNG